MDELIQRIAMLNESTLANSKVVTTSKGKALENLIGKVVTLSGILQAYAAVTENDTLAQKAALTKSDITKIRETDVEAVISPILDTARTELENLVDYGLTAESL